MTLTRPFKVTHDKLLENPEYREALLCEIIDRLLSNEKKELSLDCYNDYKKWKEKNPSVCKKCKGAGFVKNIKPRTGYSKFKHIPCSECNK